MRPAGGRECLATYRTCCVGLAGSICGTYIRIERQRRGWSMVAAPDRLRSGCWCLGGGCRSGGRDADDRRRIDRCRMDAPAHAVHRKPERDQNGGNTQRPSKDPAALGGNVTGRIGPGRAAKWIVCRNAERIVCCHTPSSNCDWERPSAGSRSNACRLRSSQYAKEEPQSLCLLPSTSWGFGNPLHSCGEFVKRISEPNHTRIIGLLVSYESEGRLRACGRMKRTSDPGH